MKKILMAVFAALTITLVMIPTQSQAVPPPGLKDTPTKCVSMGGYNGTIKVCANFKWDGQDDGDGVVVKAVEIAITEYCNDWNINFPDSIYNGTVYASASGNSDSFANLNDCSAYRTVQVRGKDVGKDYFTADFKVNKNVLADKWVRYACEIYPNGDTAVCGITQIS